MTEWEQGLIRGLSKCSFYPGSWVKKFVCSLASYTPEQELTEKQQAALARVAWHFRKQLARHGIIVETRPLDVRPDPKAAATQRELEALKAWNEGKPL